MRQRRKLRPDGEARHPVGAGHSQVRGEELRVTGEPFISVGWVDRPPPAADRVLVQQWPHVHAQPECGSVIDEHCQVLRSGGRAAAEHAAVPLATHVKRK